MEGSSHLDVPSTKTVVGLTALFGAGLWYYFSRRSDREWRGGRKESRGLIGKLRNQGKKFVIFYGSQSGTAAGFARRLAGEAVRFGLKAVVVDPDDVDNWNELTQIAAMPTNVVVFCMATYGEGDPTDNARNFCKWLESTETRLDGINYAVFGLGDRSYERFNATGKFVDERLHACGARRIFDLGLGDHNENIEEDFVTWMDEFWTTICRTFELRELAYDWKRQYELIEHPLNSLPAEEIYDGEIGWIGQYREPNPVYYRANPFLATLSTKTELCSGDRSCIHLEFRIRSEEFYYETGDHLAVYPSNQPEIVRRFGELLRTNLDRIITLRAKDRDYAEADTPFPCPTSYRTALTHYVDVTAPPDTHVLKEISKFCVDEEEKRKLVLLSSATGEGKARYKEWILDDCRSIIHVLEDLPSCKPPLDLLLEILPRLQPRYFSISSAPAVHRDSVHIVASVIAYKTPTGRNVQGVTTGMLAKTTVGSRVPIYPRASNFRMPSSVKTPIIMVGPGTGVAPFRAFLQERRRHRRAGLEVGKCYLFFGCRRRDEDFLYRVDLEDFRRDGTCQLFTAFSREQASKVYVTDLLAEQKDLIWRILGGHGAFYVCGEARTMARDVRQIVIEALQEKGNMTAAAASAKLKELEDQRRYRTDVWST